MQIEFYKYHGTGNDFVMINNYQGQFQLTKDQIVRICDRHFGIGSDGLILLEKSETAAYKMNFYNPDGSQSLCGNGARCTYQFALDQGLVNQTIEFEAIDGIHSAKKENEQIAINMNPVSKMEFSDQYYFIHTGSPHYIGYKKNLESIDLVPEARKIRYSDRYKTEGTNVNFVEEIDGQSLKMRTYERGVENETLSCGTGVTAVALSFGLRNPGSSEVRVITKGGHLRVSFEYSENRFSNIWLKGPAELVYRGQIEI